eukprot:614033-Rhodomonas_salina.1
MYALLMTRLCVCVHRRYEQQVMVPCPGCGRTFSAKVPNSATGLRARYRMSGTHAAYAATRTVWSCTPRGARTLRYPAPPQFFDEHAVFGADALRDVGERREGGRRRRHGTDMSDADAGVQRVLLTRALTCKAYSWLGH